MQLPVAAAATARAAAAAPEATAALARAAMRTPPASAAGLLLVFLDFGGLPFRPSGPAASEHIDAHGLLLGRPCATDQPLVRGWPRRGSWGSRGSRGTYVSIASPASPKPPTMEPVFVAVNPAGIEGSVAQLQDEPCVFGATWAKPGFDATQAQGAVGAELRRLVRPCSDRSE